MTTRTIVLILQSVVVMSSLVFNTNSNKSDHKMGKKEPDHIRQIRHSKGHPPVPICIFPTNLQRPQQQQQEDREPPPKVC